ncbi:beta-glucan synthesis-associated protein [Microsporum audouinii]
MDPQGPGNGSGNGPNRLRKTPTLQINSQVQREPQNPFADSSNNITNPSSASSTLAGPSPITPRALISPQQRTFSPSPVPPDSLSRNESTERLAVPGRSRAYVDDSSQGYPYPNIRRSSAGTAGGGLGGTDYTGFSSRRTSWSSDAASRHASYGYGGYTYSSPFDDSRVPSRAGSSDDENGITTQTVTEKFAIFPDGDLIVYPHDVEKDDELHNPDPNDKERKCDIWHRRGITNIGALILLIGGVLTLFIGYPVISYIHGLTTIKGGCAGDPMCIDVDIPLLKNIRTGLIDPDTPKSAMTKKSADGKDMELVFSDEFKLDGRTFFQEDDPYLQAVDIWYGVTQDLEWYDPDAVTTKDGKLELRFDAFQNHYLNYRSGMVQSWNQLCFTGGRLEASISLPGRGDVSGLWPGFWAMGNLGRPGYPATTDGMWPYSYHDECDAGITANQSDPGGLSFLPGMRLPACTCQGADHPTPGKSRTSPEIDVIEASVHALHGEKEPINVIGDVSQSCQVAPFDIWYMPNYEFTELYDPSITIMNAYRGGVFQQAISGVTNLNNDWYNGKKYQVYAFDYTPGEKGDITWYVGEEKSWKLDARALGPNGNVGQRVIPKEPMALIANLGMSNSFAALNMTGLAPLFPVTMRIDYIRIYQEKGKTSVTCDPPGMETTEYIRKHKEVYHNPNLTTWKKSLLVLLSSPPLLPTSPSPKFPPSTASSEP